MLGCMAPQTAFADRAFHELVPVIVSISIQCRNGTIARSCGCKHANTYHSHCDICSCSSSPTHLLDRWRTVNWHCCRRTAECLSLAAANCASRERITPDGTLSCKGIGRWYTNSAAGMYSCIHTIHIQWYAATSYLIP